MNFFGKVIAVFLLLTPAAEAATVSFNFSGNTTSGSVFPSALLTGSVTYDTSSYTNDLVGSLSINTSTFTFAPKPAPISGLNSIYVYNNVGMPPFDSVSFYAGITGPDVVWGSTTYRPSYVVLSFGNETDVLSSAAIPSNPDVLNDFSVRYVSPQFEILDSSGSGTGAYTGIMFTPSVAVNATPIPATFPLFAFGLGALVLLGWGKKKGAQAT